MPILDWETGAAAISDRLRDPATLRICVKVRDEPALLRSWIEHHAPIVGAGNLIIADNDSQMPEALEIYDTMDKSIVAFRYRGPHNDIHGHGRFDPLFETLRNSTRFVLFADVDERLVRIGTDGWNANAGITEHVASRRADRIVFVPWLVNCLGAMHAFSIPCDAANGVKAHEMRMGKPILPGRFVGRHSFIHNFQYGDFACGNETINDLFLLHLTQFPEQRIRANMKKLVSRGVIGPEVDVADLLRMHFAALPDQSFMPLVNEIRWMAEHQWKIGRGLISPGPHIHPNALLLFPGGRLDYVGAEARDNFARFRQEAVARPHDVFDAAA
ncbi:hypothetical protein [Falsiroseomonas sp. HW251]|uniref:hypothetical protein n=1 Tax=Falsiroseomonas sp. HW251 TaxID=3390998 RepID=UPI003D30F936